MTIRCLMVVLTFISVSSPSGVEADPVTTPAMRPLALTAPQQRILYLRLVRRGISEQAPPGFSGKIGETLPASIHFHPLPPGAADIAPPLRSCGYAMLYYFAMFGNVVLIVEPRSRTIVDVIMPLTGAW